jgi:hypothetical protein
MLDLTAIDNIAYGVTVTAGVMVVVLVNLPAGHAL